MGNLVRAPLGECLTTHGPWLTQARPVGGGGPVFTCSVPQADLQGRQRDEPAELEGIRVALGCRGTRGGLFGSHTKGKGMCTGNRQRRANEEVERVQV